MEGSSSHQTRVFKVVFCTLVFCLVLSSPRIYRYYGSSEGELFSVADVECDLYSSGEHRNFSKCSQQGKHNTSKVVDPFVRYLWKNNTCSNTENRKEDNNADNEHGSKRPEDKKSSRRRTYCQCECRASDRIRSGRLASKSCRLSRKMGYLPRLAYAGVDGGSISYYETQTSDSGKRSRKLKSLTWSVDHCSNNRGQVGRNSRRTGANETSWQGTVLIASASFVTKNRTMLLMYGSEGRDSEEGGNGGITRDTLVSLAILVMFLGDSFVQGSAEKVRRHVSRCLQKPSRELSRASGTHVWSEALARFTGFFSTSRGCPAFRDGGYGLEELSKPPKMPDFFVNPKTFQTDLWVAPAMGFLPNVSTHNKDHMNHTGYRMASLAALPPSCPMSRVKLAEAGFHFDPRSNSNAVVCHKCGIALGINENMSPLAYHHSASPNCEFLRNLLNTYTDQPSSLSSSSTSNSSTQSQESSGASSIASGSLSMSTFPSSLNSASTSLSQPSTDSGMGSSLGTTGSSMSSLSITSYSSQGPTSAASGLASVPSALPTDSCGATSAAVTASAVVTSAPYGGKPSQVDGCDQTDHRMELCTDGAEVTDSRPSVDSPMHAAKPTTHLADKPAASAAVTGYFLALPTTSADISSNPTINARNFSSSHSLFTVSAARAALSSPQVLGSNPGSEPGPRPSLDLTNAVYPQFSTVRARMETYTNWPLKQRFPPQLMSTLGFYYAGYADCVRCFFCGVGLKTWDEDDEPEVEHIRWRATCQFLLATKGKAYVESVLARINVPEKNQNAPAANNHQDQAPRPNPPGTPTRPSRTESTRPGTQPRRDVQQAPAQIQAPAGQGPQASPQGRDIGPGDGVPEPLMITHLRNMGFSQDAINRAHAQIRNLGQRPSLQRMLDLLLGGNI